MWFFSIFHTVLRRKTQEPYLKLLIFGPFELNQSGIVSLYLSSDCLKTISTFNRWMHKTISDIQPCNSGLQNRKMTWVKKISEKKELFWKIPPKMLKVNFRSIKFLKIIKCTPRTLAAGIVAALHSVKKREIYSHLTIISYFIVESKLISRNF